MDFIPYGKQEISRRDIREVIKVLKSDFLTQGPKVPEFESKIVDFIGVEFCTVVNSATSALHIACLALDLKEGDWLWTSPITFVASANCAIYCNARVDFVDIDSKTGLMCMEKLERKLIDSEKKGKLPKIVIPVHLGGASCDMYKLHNLSKKFGFKIIEDASHAIGGKFSNEFVGNCKFSDISVFSFHPVKVITSAEGGAALTNQKDIDIKLKDLRTHGIVRNNERFINKSNQIWYYEQQKLGFNYRMSDIHAALGASQLDRLNSIIKKRNRILFKYYDLANGLPLKFQEIPKNVLSSVHLAIVILDDIYMNKYNEIFNQLRESKIGVQLHYMPVHLQPFYRKYGFKEGDFPNSEKYAKTALSLPIFPNLNFSKQKYIIKKLKTVLCSI